MCLKLRRQQTSLRPNQLNPRHHHPRQTSHRSSLQLAIAPLRQLLMPRRLSRPSSRALRLQAQHQQFQLSLKMFLLNLLRPTLEHLQSAYYQQVLLPARVLLLQ
jgi:hypothetical protein